MQTTILSWILSHIGLSIAGGSVLGATVLHLAAPKITASACAALGKLMGKEIVAAETIKTGDPEIDGRLNLTVLILMDVAKRKMPAALGEEKKKYVMSYFATTAPVIKETVSSAIDQLWAVWKDSIDKGVSAPQEAIIAAAVAQLQVLTAPQTPATPAVSSAPQPPVNPTA